MMCVLTGCLCVRAHLTWHFMNKEKEKTSFYTRPNVKTYGPKSMIQSSKEQSKDARTYFRVVVILCCELMYGKAVYAAMQGQRKTYPVPASSESLMLLVSDSVLGHIYWKNKCRMIKKTK